MSNEQQTPSNETNQEEIPSYPFPFADHSLQLPEEYDRLWQQCPVARVHMPYGGDAFMPIRYEEIAQAFAEPGLAMPMVGASGAISGVLAAYVLIYPRSRVTVIIPLGFLLYPTKISAVYVVGFWFILQLFSALITQPGAPGTAWWAHVGGFAAGFVLTPLLSQFPLFGRH